MRTTRTRALAALGLVALLGGTVLALSAVSDREAEVPSAPDVIYHNAQFVTVDADFGIAEAVAVSDGRFTAVGSSDEVRALAAPETRSVDLEGRTVLPGFHDCHAHLYRGDDQFESWPSNVHDLRHFADVDVLLDTLRMIADETPSGDWIHGRLSETGFPDAELPERWTLDEAVPDHPLALPRGPHTWTVNSRALELAGITRETPDPEGGYFERNEAGEPTGHLREGAAQRFVGRLLPPEEEPTPDEIKTDLYNQLRLLVSLGITSANVAGGYSPGDRGRWIQDVYDRSGDELPRLNLQLRVSPGHEEGGIEDAIERMDDLGFRTGLGDDRLRLGGIKMSVDGGFTGRAAHLLEPYPDGTYGSVRIPEDALYEVGRWAHDKGWQLGIHVIGDAGIEMTVDVLDRILREGAEREHRHFLHHVSVVPPEETISKLARNDISVCSQANFTYDLAPFYAQALSGERLARNNPQRTLQEGGVRLAYGSDHRPYGPVAAIWSALRREGRDGEVYGRDLEAVTVEEAIRSHTMGSAYLSYSDDDRGSIEVGKRADMVVLTDDILTRDPATIHHIGVVQTIMEGEVVYEAEDRPRVARFDDGEFWYAGGEASGGPGSHH